MVDRIAVSRQHDEREAVVQEAFVTRRTKEKKGGITMAENPCIICEEYIKGRLCDKRNVCPVGIMKRKYLETKRELKEISKKADKLQSDADWDWEIRNSSPGRDFW